MVSSKLKISVAIVFYNPNPKDVEQALSNIQRLCAIDSFDFSFYLIDNASPKQDLASLLPRKLGNKIFFKKLNKNNGFGSGHNSIIHTIDSDFHIVMNPDIDIQDVDGFTRAINYMEHNKDVVLLSPLVRNKNDGEIQLLNRKEPTVFDLFIRFLGPRFFANRQADFEKKGYGYDHIQIDENATGSFMVLRTKDFKYINGFDSKFFMYFEDTDLTKRISERGKVIFYPYLTVVHGWKRENHTIKGLIPMVKSMITYFNKWGWKWI